MSGYGDRYDAAILAEAEAGATAPEIGRKLRISVVTVRRRAEIYGLRGVLAERGIAAARDMTGRARIRSVFFTDILTRNGRDEIPSIIVRTLRAKPDAAVRVFDSAHAIACLHRRGVTLSDLQDYLGVEPVSAIAAIRAYSDVEG